MDLHRRWWFELLESEVGHFYALFVWNKWRTFFPEFEMHRI